jgi:SAM-dependent methyltransferase
VKIEQRGSSLDAYERRIGRWSRRAAEEFLRWLALPQGGCWLDVGAGTGALTAAISETCAPALLFGIDSSPADLYYGRERRLSGGATLVAADAAALPFHSATFDGVVSALLLNHLRDPTLAVVEMVRVARPGGTVAAYVWDFGGEMQPLRLFWDAAMAVDPAAAERDQALKFPVCRIDRLAALFSASGLRAVGTHGLDVAADFRSFTDLWEPLVTGDGSVVEYTRSLPPERLVALRDRLRESVSVAADGSIHLIARALAVRGRVGTHARVL